MGRGKAQQAKAGRTRLRRPVKTADPGWRAWVRPGRLDFNSIELFQTGHCHSLALSFHKQLGSPIWAQCDENSVPIHFLSEVRPGLLLDSYGVYTIEEYQKRSSKSSHPNLFKYESKEEFLNTLAEGGFLKIKEKLSDSFVEPLLEKYSEQLKEKLSDSP
jgi:hypothetical protein